MKILENIAICLAVSLSLSSCCSSDVEKPDEALTQVTFEKVTLQDNFWLPRLKTQKETLVPFSFEKMQTAIETLEMLSILRTDSSI